MRCTFLGHKDTPQNIANLLRALLMRLIAESKADDFYVGDQGGFDGVPIA